MKIKVLFTLITLWLCLGGVKVYAQTYIGTEAELRAFATAVNNPDPDKAKTYEGEYIYLIADIPLVNSWIPIGTADRPFKGYFEGWGHTISNLNVTGSNDYAGLFGYINGGSVRDVGIASGSISGGNNVGGICGHLLSGEISSCYNMATVSGSAYVGGICGQSGDIVNNKVGGVIKNCYNTGNVVAIDNTSYYYAGGLVGASLGELRHCYVTGTVNLRDIQDNSYFGQIVGYWTNWNLDGGKLQNLACCVYNNESSYISGYEGSDVAIGSPSGPSSPLPEVLDAANVISASTSEMKCQTKIHNPDTGKDEIVWKDILNDYSEEVLKNNIVWHIEDGFYPQLYSFEKNLPITFNFTEQKNWLTIVPNGNYKVPEGVTAYKVVSATAPTDEEAGVATLVKVTTLNEGCGALLYSEVGEAILANERPTGELDDYTDNLLKGSPTSPETIGGTEWEESSDYILQDGAFVKANLGTIARGKAYLHAPFPAGSKLRFVFADESMTGINAVEENLESDAVWYTLDGRKMEGEPTEKGVYIVNGKKVMIQ